MDYFRLALERCNIPIIDVNTDAFNYSALSRKEYQLALNFTKNLHTPNRIVVHGKEHFEWTIRLCRSSLVSNITRDMKFYMYKQLFGTFGNNLQMFKYSMDTLVICGIQDEDDYKNKQTLLTILGESLTTNKNILLSTSNSNHLSEVCSSMWDVIDKTFSPIKV